MLIREVLKPDPIKFAYPDYRYAIVPLNDGTTIYIEWYPATRYDVWLLPGTFTTQVQCGLHHIGEKNLLSEADEFEAQMVFDHYIESIGRKKIARKRSGDTRVT